MELVKDEWLCCRYGGTTKAQAEWFCVEWCVRVSFPPNISEGSFSEQGLLVCVQGKAVLLL